MFIACFIHKIRQDMISLMPGGGTVITPGNKTHFTPANYLYVYIFDIIFLVSPQSAGGHVASPVQSSAAG